jgi:hypothetical protein
MRVPDGTVVKGGECLSPRDNIFESPDPNEPVGSIEISELPNYRNPERFLGLDELSIEDLDQSVALAWMQGVLPQLD